MIIQLPEYIRAHILKVRYPFLTNLNKLLSLRVIWIVDRLVNDHLLEVLVLGQDLVEFGLGDDGHCAEVAGFNCVGGVAVEDALDFADDGALFELAEEDPSL